MIGETLSHYRITAHLGAGGMGEVFKAEDTKLGREVAIKVLQSDIARDMVRLERFSREARAVASLNHPNIVTIYSVEEADGKHFITMELVEGETLDERIVEGGLPLNRLFDIALPLADALCSAHEKGIVHRDLKPANVMVTKTGNLKVLDFGLAKLQNTDSDMADAETVSRLLTQDGTVLGTYPYMSPEQVEGKHLDQRTDLFSLGTMVYELATGNRPFAGDSSPALMSSILRDEPGSLAEIRPDLPRHLNRIICRCLEKNPRDRYQSARSLYNELKGLRRESVSDASIPGSSISYGRARQSTKLTWIAVLPIKGTSNDQEMLDFADGLSEDITAGLSKFPYLSIVARESTLRFAGQTSDVRETSEKLGARYVIDGGVRKAGSTMRVSMRLVDAQTGTNLWTETYTRNTEAQDIFATQDDITERVVATVADGYGVLARSLIAEIEDKPDEELTPAEWMLRTFDYLSHMTPESHASTRDGLGKAVERYPRDPDVWACLSNLYVHEHCFLFNPLPDPLDRSLAAAEKAIELDRTCQFGYQMLAQSHFFRGDLVAFRAARDRAISLNPQDSNTIGILGIITVHSGDREHGAELCRRAMAINPHHAGWYHFGPMWLHFGNKDYEKALARIIQVNMPGLFWTYLATASTCGHLGREREAQNALSKLLELEPEFASQAHRSLEVWHFTSGLLEPILEGLRKAGLDVDDEVTVEPAPDPGAPGRIAQRAESGTTTKNDSAVAVAVLPFTDMSPGKDQEFFCEGMAEEIMNALTNVDGIRVASRMSAFRARSEGKNPAEIGRALSVGEILEGSVRMAGERMRVTAQLIDVNSGYQLWSERYDRDTDDIFAVQDEIAESVVEVVRARLAPDAGSVRERQKVNNLDAYRHYLKGRYFRYTKNDHASAIREYEQSVALDANYGPAWAGLAEATILAAGYGLIPSEEAYTTAREAITTADRLQGESAEALLVEGMLGCLQWEWETAEKALRRAIAIRPDHVQSLGWLGFFLSLHQRSEEACVQFDLAREADPLAAFASAMTACGLAQMRQLEEALPFAEQAVALDEQNTLAIWIFGMILIALGRHDEGIGTLKRAAELGRRGGFILGILGWALAIAGRRSEAESILNELRARGDDAPPLVSEAWLLGALGQFEDAWEALERVLDQQQLMVLFVGFQGFDTLRNDPRFDELLSRMGLPAPPVRDTVRPTDMDGASTNDEPAAVSQINPSGGDTAPRSLAVLPLANLSGDPQQEFFVAGMHDALINELARIKSLTVISRTSTMPFSDSTEPLPDIAEKLGVEAVIEGSVLKAGNQVRINLQLVNATPERHLWADSFDGEVEDIFDLHSRVAKAVSGAVRARLTDDEEQRLATQRKVDPKVYEIYLRAEHLGYMTPEKNFQGIRLYEKAIALDPEFAPAYAGMARNYVNLSTLGASSPLGSLAKAADAARKAMELDPQSGEARSIHGYVSLFLDWDWQTAASAMTEAREMEPNNVGVLADSVIFLALSGDTEQAVALMDHAAELDPMSPQTLFWKGWARFVAERFEEAIVCFGEALDLNPSMPYATLWTGAAHGLMNDSGPALEWARRAEALAPDSTNTDFLAVLAATYVMGNQPEEARRLLSHVESLENDEQKFPTQRSYIHGWLGEYEEAADLSDIAFDERNPGVIYWGNHPVCDASRAHPRIVQRLEELGFPAIRPMKPWQPAEN